MEKSDVIVGLGYGDEGKGTSVSYLASKRKTNAVLKFSGGAQCAHNVTTADGRHHTFAQFGSASFHYVPTILSRFFLVNPFNMAAEGAALKSKIEADPFKMTYVSENALLTTPLHVEMNQRREIARGREAHGSCGLGIGETQLYENISSAAPRIKDLKDFKVLRHKLEEYLVFAESEVGLRPSGKVSVDDLLGYYDAFLNDHCFNIVSDDFITEYLKQGYNIFEGSQGLLLDEDLGFHPHTTWSTVSAENAKTLASEAGIELNIIGVTRSYSTRHGAGPFPSELSAEAKLAAGFTEKHNTWGKFQGGWRVGMLDLPLLEYAARANGGVDEVAVTHLDAPYQEVVTKYTGMTTEIPTDFFGKNTNFAAKTAVTDLLTSEEFRASAVIKKVSSETELLDLICAAVKTGKVAFKSYGPTDEEKISVS